MSNNNQLFNRIDAILDGIDRQEDDPKGGWWHTEDGARVGRIKLRELKEAIQEHLITMAGTACAGATPVNLADLHDPDFSAGLSPGEHLNRLSGVAPSRPALLPTEEEILTWLQLKDDATAYWADDVPAFILEALKQWGQVAPITPQPAAIAQQADDPTDDELLRAYGAAKRSHQYDGPSDDWPNRAERAATVYGLRAVLTRHGRPTFQPIPVSERLPGPQDCTPWPDTTTISWCWVATDDDGEWGWNQYSIGPSDFGDNLSRIMRGRGYTHWAPWWAFPLPGSHSPGATEEAEGQS
jgi:hypothetical protein